MVNSWRALYKVVCCLQLHYNDVLMSAMASQNTSLTIVYSTVYSGRSNEQSKFRVTGLCEENSPVTGEFPAQRASNAGLCFHLITSSCVHPCVTHVSPKVWRLTIYSVVMQTQAIEGPVCTNNGTDQLSSYHMVDNLLPECPARQQMTLNEVISLRNDLMPFLIWWWQRYYVIYCKDCR